MEGRPGDHLNAHIHKVASRVTLKALVSISNRSISESNFCARWKFHVVVPHHKKGEKGDVSNYRPVCHLIEMGKMVELVVWDQLMSHCVHHRIIHPNHHGSIPSHDCATALGQIQDLVTQAADRKQLAAVVMVNQTASYDLVDRRDLLEKVTLYNFHHKTVAWFASYLEERRFSTQVETALSEPRDLADHGVPQGSILGGLLFCTKPE